MHAYAVDLGDLRRSALGHYGSNSALPWLIVVQILHCGTFTVCTWPPCAILPLARVAKSSVYSGLLCRRDGRQYCDHDRFRRFLYQYLGHGVFWVMALVALPQCFCARKLFPHADSSILRICPVDVLSTSGPYRSAVVKRAERHGIRSNNQCRAARSACLQNTFTDICLMLSGSNVSSRSCAQSALLARYHSRSVE